MAFEIRGTIGCTHPFDLSHSLAFLDRFSPMAGEQSTSAGMLQKAFLHHGRTALARVRQQRAGEVSYELVSERPIADARPFVDRLRHFLTTDEDLGPFGELAARDGCFGPVVARLRGFHHVTFPSAFEAACWGTLNQRVGMAAARRMKETLTRELGGAITVGDETFRAFPEPHLVAAAGEERIAGLIRNGRKARTLAALAEAFSDETEPFLRRAPLDRAEAWLRAIHGVGPFASAFVLFRGLGRFVRLPVAPGLVEAAERVYRRPLSTEKLLELAAGYGEWGGHFALYLWRSTMGNQLTIG